MILLAKPPHLKHIKTAKSVDKLNKMIPEHGFSTFNPDRRYFFSKFDWNEPSPYDDDVVHRHTYSELLFIKTGAANHWIAHDKFEAHAKEIHLVNAGIAHNFQRNQDCQGFTIAFDDAVVLDPTTQLFLEQRGFFNPIFSHLQGSLFDEICLLANLISSQNKNQKHTLYIVNAIFEQLKLNTTEKDQSFSSTHWFYDFIQYMKENWKSKPRAHDVAQELHLSKEQLNARVNESFGVSTEELINRYLLNYIKKELMFSDQNISALALEFGFYDASHFTRYFKKHEGISPGKFAQSLLREM